MGRVAWRSKSGEVSRRTGVEVMKQIRPSGVGGEELHEAEIKNTPTLGAAESTLSKRSEWPERRQTIWKAEKHFLSIKWGQG